jgi:adenine-specific DNA-methyltransferase
MENKKKVFENYLNNNIEIQELIIQLDNLQEKERKSKGVIYTPWDIVKKMVDINHIDYDTTIIEPSCGHGIFLFGILEHMRLNFKMSPELLFNWFISHVVGVEINPNTILELREILHYYFKKQGLIINQDEFQNIINSDSLIFDIALKFDLCLGNPPYIRARELNPNYLSFLKTHFSSCSSGNTDIYYAFIEKYSQMAQSLCFITPNGFIDNKSAQVLRSLIVEKMTYLLDFKEKLVFPDARTYTCIFKLNQNQTNEFEYTNDINEAPQIIDKIKIFSLPQTNKSKTNANIEPVLAGIATLCDTAFLVKKEKEKYYASFENTQYEIEKAIVAPYLKLTKQKNAEMTLKYMIYPYDQERVIIDEKTLKQNYPLAYHYLEQVKALLAKRDKGKTDKYEAWYAYGRRQGLHEFKTKEIITIPLMIGKDCLPQKLNITQLLKEYTNIIFSSGYVIPIDSNNEQIANLVLTEAFLDYARKNGRAWPGKDVSYYTLKPRQIRQFKV